MAKGFLLTVGTSVHSEVFAIKEIKPDYTAFICTHASREKLDDIIELTDLKPSSFRTFEIADKPSEIGKLVLKSHEAYRWLCEKCGENADIWINPTAGRKWMSTGLGLFGSRTNAHQIYLDVDFDPIMNKPDPTTMKIVNLGDAQEHTGIFDADAGVKMFNRFDFEGARLLFDSITPRSILSRQFYSAFSGICDAMVRWDRFEHYSDKSTVSSTGLQSLNQLREACEELQMNHLNEFITGINKLLDSIRMVEESPKPCLPAIVDLVMNAQRRIESGRTDDGVARLYRVLEAVAQLFLSEKNIDTSKIDWQIIEDPVKEAFCKRFNSDQNPMTRKTGLEKSFYLAKLLNLNSADSFFNTQEVFIFNRILRKRNGSILAHGWFSIGEQDARKFLDKLKTKISEMGGDLARWEVTEMPRLWT